MADLKISQLDAITVLAPATDVLPVVSSGTTKKITTNQILGSGGTATLASATITGNLTVDTSTLFVDSSNDRVGIGTATPAAKLIVRDGSNRNLLVSSDASQLGSAGVAIGSFTDNAAGYAPLSIIAGTSIGFGINGSTAMTLNAAGLGVGGSAAARIHAIDSTGACALFTRTAPPAAALSALYIQAPVSSGFSNTTVMTFWYQNTGISNPASETLSIRTNSAERIRYGSDGNAYHSLQGVAPSIPNNGEMVFNFTSNTNLRISARGSDGVTRVANITLA
jgi:hypothetical protein